MREEDLLQDRVRLAHPSKSLLWWQACISLVVIVVGAGIMALPQQPKLGGSVLSITIMFCCAAANAESGIAMWEAIMAYNTQHSNQQVITYEDLARAGFGDSGESYLTCIVVPYFIGVTAGFTVLIATGLESLFGSWLSKKAWVLLISPVLGSIALFPNITSIARFAPIAIAAVFAMCVIIMTKSVIDAQYWQAWPEQERQLVHEMWPTSTSSLGVVVAVSFGACGMTANVPSVLCEMEHPDHFPRVMRSAMTLVVLVYMAVMTCGYYGYGQFIQNDVIESMERAPANFEQAFQGSYANWTGPSSKLCGRIVSALLIVKCTVCLPLNQMVIFYSLQTFRATAARLHVGTWANVTAARCRGDCRAH
eukprot:TRINITY_DN89392_c0_g1_i1.p1 TRINITY_DN89392_c0_g1~~TRINITY_DN89392_c0_g1_i1.p1  ORF type:complete len:365 (+),score=55.05 TRINITY_DN89392_c0_g1_i1:84-1178(+)